MGCVFPMGGALVGLATCALVVGCFSFVVLGYLCPGCGQGSGLSFVPELWACFSLWLGCLLAYMLVGCWWLVVASSSFMGGKAFVIRWCLYWVDAFSYFLGEVLSDFRFFLVASGFLYCSWLLGFALLE